MDITGFSVPQEIAMGRDCCLGTIMGSKVNLAVGEEVKCQCGSVIRRDAEKSITLVSIGDGEYIAVSYPLATNGGMEIHTGYVNPKTGAFRWDVKKV